MKKKIFLLLTVLFCLCAVLALTACGGTETPGGNDTPGGDEGGDTPTTPEHTHSFGEWIETTAPTCVAKGEETRSCTCGEEEKRDVAIAPEAHSFGEWAETTAPTCMAKGEETRSCTCGEEEKRDVAIDPEAHSFGEWIETTAPTCTTRGIKIHVCACGHSETQYIDVDPNAHAPAATWTTDGTNHWKVCTRTGCTVQLNKGAHTPAAWSSDATNHWGDCAVCGYDIPPAAHTYDAENTCACGDYKDKGVRFTLSNGTYEVSGYTGTATEVVIPATYKGIAVTSIGGEAFSGCSSLTTITIPASVTSIGNSAFAWCSQLTTVEFGANSKLTSIGEDAFWNCSNLTSITIPDSVTSIGNSAFSGCSGLTSITVASGNTKYHSAGNCLIETATGTLVLGCKNSVIPADGSVTSIGDNAFSGCTGLTSITIPEGVTSIGNYAFSGCSGLTSITVASGNTKYHSAGNCLIETATGTLVLGCKNSVIPADGSVTSIGDEAFYDCDSLTTITIPDSVTSIGEYAFLHCSNLTSITIPASVTSIGYNAFRSCSQLTTVTLGANSKLTSIGTSAFHFCSKLTTVYYGGSASDWGKITIGNDNGKLTSATRYYYSATEPTEAGNWWYYDQNGKPAIWGK